LSRSRSRSRNPSIARSTKLSEARQDSPIKVGRVQKSRSKSISVSRQTVFMVVEDQLRNGKVTTLHETTDPLATPQFIKTKDSPKVTLDASQLTDRSKYAGLRRAVTVSCGVGASLGAILLLSSTPWPDVQIQDLAASVQSKIDHLFSLCSNP